LGIEGGKGAADDLVAGVSLDSLRAFVPAGNPAGGIKHEDSVVPDALDQQPEAFIARARGGAGIHRHALMVRHVLLLSHGIVRWCGWAGLIVLTLARVRAGWLTNGSARGGDPNLIPWKRGLNSCSRGRCPVEIERPAGRLFT